MHEIICFGLYLAFIHADLHLICHWLSQWLHLTREHLPNIYIILEILRLRWLAVSPPDLSLIIISRLTGAGVVFIMHIHLTSTCFLQIFSIYSQLEASLLDELWHPTKINTFSKMACYLRKTTCILYYLCSRCIWRWIFGENSLIEQHHYHWLPEENNAL